MKYTLDHLKEFKRMFARHLKVKGKQFTPLGEDANEICLTTIERLWNKKFFQTSLGNYPVFYARDFSMMVESLLTLGYKTKVIQTLDYALSCYQKAGHIKTYIRNNTKPVNFPNVYSPDSVAYMIRSVSIVNDKDLTKKYFSFLQDQVDEFAQKVIDQKTGTVKRKKHFGGMRDYSKRDSSCYDTVMAGVVSLHAQKLGLRNPLQKFNYAQILKETYWTGSYFKDDQRSDQLTADANIFPFWLGIITDKKMLRKTIRSMQQANLDKPFPIKYVAHSREKGIMIFLEKFVSNWEADAIWPMSALPFIELVLRVNPSLSKKYLMMYKDKIEEYKTFIEVYDKNGKPYKSSFYSCDEGMIWSALYLVLAQRLKPYC